MKAQIGFLQELQSDGSVANSQMRLLSMGAFIGLWVYCYFSFINYNMKFAAYVELLKAESISEQSFITLTMQMNQLDWDIFAILMTAIFVPKAIQKAFEAKTGVRGSSESSITKTVTIDKTSNVPPAQTPIE